MGKRNLLAFLLTGLLVFTGTTVNAENSTEGSSSCGKFDIKNSKDKILFEQEPTEDIEILFKNAKEGKGFLEKGELEKLAIGKVTLEGEGKTKVGKKKSVELETIATSELVEKYEIDGNVHEVFTVTEFAIVTDELLDYTAGNEVLMMSSDYDDEYKWDSSYSVKAYSTNYFSRTYANGENSCIDLTSVAGGWTINDSQVSVGTKRVNWGQTGRRCDNGASITQTSSYYYPGSLTYSYNVASAWVGVSLTATATVVGHTTYAELTRGSSLWTLSFNNNVLT
jgi:hypothetical protein